jgi:hypothetical protein
VSAGCCLNKGLEEFAGLSGVKLRTLKLDKDGIDADIVTPVKVIGDVDEDEGVPFQISRPRPRPTPSRYRYQYHF